MARIRVEKETNFTHLENKLLQNSNLSLKARGLLAYMLSLPEDWNYSIAGLSSKCKEGKSSIRSAIDELMSEGYVVRRLVRTEKGVISGYEYIVYEVPQPSCDFQTTVDEPSCGFPSTENPSSGNRTQQNNKEQNNQETKEPPKPPLQGGVSGRKSKFDLAEDAKPLLRAYVDGDRELHQVLGDMIENRRELRAINSKRAIKMLLDELDRLSGGSRANKLALLRRAKASSWKTVYPMRPDELPEKIRPGTVSLQDVRGGGDCGFR